MYHPFQVAKNKFSNGMKSLGTADDIEVCSLHCMRF